MSHAFEPDWTLHPGVALAELLDERGITAAELAGRAQLGPETVAGLLNFIVPVDSVIAGCLEKALSSPSARFWLNYQGNYDADQARDAEDVSRDSG